MPRKPAEQQQYALLKLGGRGEVPDNWLDAIWATKGVIVRESSPEPPLVAMIHCTPAIAERLAKKFPYVKFYPAGPVKQGASLRAKREQQTDLHADPDLDID